MMTTTRMKHRFSSLLAVALVTSGVTVAGGVARASATETVVSDCAEASLRAAVAVGGTVRYSIGCNLLSTGDQIVVPLGLDVRIEAAPGQELVIDARNTHRHFFVDGGTLTLVGLTLVNGYIEGDDQDAMPPAATGAPGAEIVVDSHVPPLDCPPRWNPFEYDLTMLTGGDGDGGEHGTDGGGARGGSILIQGGIVVLDDTAINTSSVRGGSGGRGGRGGNGGGGGTLSYEDASTCGGSGIPPATSGGSGGNGGPGGSGGDGGAARGGGVYNAGTLVMVRGSRITATATGGLGGLGGRGGNGGNGRDGDPGRSSGSSGGAGKVGGVGGSGGDGGDEGRHGRGGAAEGGAIYNDGIMIVGNVADPEWLPPLQFEGTATAGNGADGNSISTGSGGAGRGGFGGWGGAGGGAGPGGGSGGSGGDAGWGGAGGTNQSAGPGGHAAGGAIYNSGLLSLTVNPARPTGRAELAGSARGGAPGAVTVGGGTAGPGGIGGAAASGTAGESGSGAGPGGAGGNAGNSGVDGAAGSGADGTEGGSARGGALYNVGDLDATLAVFNGMALAGAAPSGGPAGNWPGQDPWDFHAPGSGGDGGRATVIAGKGPDGGAAGLGGSGAWARGGGAGGNGGDGGVGGPAEGGAVFHTGPKTASCSDCRFGSPATNAAAGGRGGVGAHGSGGGTGQGSTAAASGSGGWGAGARSVDERGWNGGNGAAGAAGPLGGFGGLAGRGGDAGDGGDGGDARGGHVYAGGPLVVFGGVFGQANVDGGHAGDGGNGASGGSGAGASGGNAGHGGSGGQGHGGGLPGDFPPGEGGHGGIGAMGGAPGSTTSGAPGGLGGNGGDGGEAIGGAIYGAAHLRIYGRPGFDATRVFAGRGGGGGWGGTGGDGGRGGWGGRGGTGGSGSLGYNGGDNGDGKQGGRGADAASGMPGARGGAGGSGGSGGNAKAGAIFVGAAGSSIDAATFAANLLRSGDGGGGGRGGDGGRGGFGGQGGRGGDGGYWGGVGASGGEGANGGNGGHGASGGDGAVGGSGGSAGHTSGGAVWTDYTLATFASNAVTDSILRVGTPAVGGLPGTGGAAGFGGAGGDGGSGRGLYGTPETHALPGSPGGSGAPGSDGPDSGAGGDGAMSFPGHNAVVTANQAPTVSNIADVATVPCASVEVPFTFDDREDGARAAVAISWTGGLVRSYELIGTSTQRTLVLRPSPQCSPGWMTITVRVTDGSGLVAQDSFRFTIMAQPTISVRAVNSTNDPHVAATATLAAGASPTGTLTVAAYGPDDESCSGEPFFTDELAVNGAGEYVTDTATLTEGMFRWVASYSGDAGNQPATSVCGAVQAMTNVVPTGVASLGLTHSCAPVDVLPGNETTCTVTVSNAGPDAARDIKVFVDVIPPLQLTTPPATGEFTCGPSQYDGIEFECERASGAAGGSWSLTYGTTVAANAFPQTYRNFASVINDFSDGTPDNDAAWADIRVIDTRPQFAISNSRVLEGDSGSKQTLQFRVTLSKPDPVYTTSVAYSTNDGPDSSSDVDYLGKYGKRLYFAPGQVAKTVTVVVNADTQIEPDEWFYVGLHDPTSNAGIDPRQSAAIGTILDDDSATGNRIALGDATIVEGDAKNRTVILPISLSTRPSTAVTVGVATIDGTANGVRTAGTCCGDFVRVAKSISFTTTQNKKTVAITLLPDTVLDGDETFTVRLTPPPGYTIIGGDTVTITILDDDE